MPGLHPFARHSRRQTGKQVRSPPLGVGAGSLVGGGQYGGSTGGAKNSSTAARDRVRGIGGRS